MDVLVKEELPVIVADGAFGDKVNFLSFEHNQELSGQNHYTSTVIFGNVITSDLSNYPVLIKLKLRDEKQRSKQKNDIQFNNEIVMYERILPFLFKCRGKMTKDIDGPTTPRFFYGRNKCGKFGEKDLIQMEDVSPLGFRLSEDHPFLNYEHLINALQAIAKFHGLSYTAKQKDPVGFRELIADVRDTQWDSNGQWLFSNKSIVRLAKRGMDRLLEQDGGRYRDHANFRRFNELMEDGNETLRRALRPREPLSVLCHGDFCRNNVMFRYGGVDKRRPVDTLLFDFGTPRYGSPALDLSFFLYMNSTQKLRERHWDDLLDAYCAALAASVASGVPVPDRPELEAEMATSALFGFAHAIFFLPHQIEVDTSDCDRIDENEQVTILLKLGGDTGTEYVADMVQHIVDKGYVRA